MRMLETMERYWRERVFRSRPYSAHSVCAHVHCADAMYISFHIDMNEMCAWLHLFFCVWLQT